MKRLAENVREREKERERRERRERERVCVWDHALWLQLVGVQTQLLAHGLEHGLGHLVGVLLARSIHLGRLQGISDFLETVHTRELQIVVVVVVVIALGVTVRVATAVTVHRGCTSGPNSCSGSGSSCDSRCRTLRLHTGSFSARGVGRHTGCPSVL
jgi:hypothetical protein